MLFHIPILTGLKHSNNTWCRRQNIPRNSGINSLRVFALYSNKPIASVVDQLSRARQRFLGLQNSESQTCTLRLLKDVPEVSHPVAFELSHGTKSHLHPAISDTKNNQNMTKQGQQKWASLMTKTWPNNHFRVSQSQAPEKSYNFNLAMENSWKSTWIIGTSQPWGKRRPPAPRDKARPWERRLSGWSFSDELSGLGQHVANMWPTCGQDSWWIRHFVRDYIYITI